MALRPAGKDFVPWEIGVGGLLFLVGFTILSARMDTRMVIGKNTIKLYGPKSKTKIVDSLKLVSLIHAAARRSWVIYSNDIEALQEVFDDIVENIAVADDDFLSWLYQDLKKNHADSAFRKALNGEKKLANHDLLVTTQFFTDRYMVDFLVRECIAYSKIDQIDLDQIVVIDPACGGGNFLLSAFDHLWREFVLKRRLPEERIAKNLVGQILVGYDLDPLMASLCRLNLTLKANTVTGKVIAPAYNVFGGDHYRFGFLDSWNKARKAGPLCWTKFRETLSGNRQKIFVTNPPFAGRRDLHPEIRGFIKQRLPLSRGDLCIAFMGRVLETLKPGDVAGFVTQRSWMYLSSYHDFRAHALSQYALKLCVDLGPRAFKDIGGEKSSVALPIFTKSTTIDRHVCKFYRVLDPSAELKQNILLDTGKLSGRLVTVPVKIHRHARQRVKVLC